MVSWFAGLFYMVRLFIYFAEADLKEDIERKILLKQFKVMQWRLWYIIAWPAMILTMFFGIGMICIKPVFLEMPYMQLKLGFVFLLILSPTPPTPMALLKEEDWGTDIGYLF